MPTGYTEDVANGKITDFNEYALQCARNFGACITLRDEPMTSEIPEFVPSDHNAKRLAEAKKDLAAFLAMDHDQREKLRSDEHAENARVAEKGIAEKQVERERYEAMLAKAKAYKSPSPDHDNYAGFLVSQLEESIQWDCSTDYYDGLQQQKPFGEWESEKLERLKRDVAYHEKANREEIERTDQRNEWVRKLKASLEDVPQVV